MFDAPVRAAGQRGGRRAKMGALTSPGWFTITSAVIAAIIIGLNMKMISDLAFG